MKNFDNLLKVAGNEYAVKISEGNDSDTTEFIDTGSYILNALLSGSIYGGIPSNKVTAFAGEEATGKSFFALNICAAFLENNPDGAVFYFESEHAITTEMLDNRGIDKERFYKVPVVTVQEFRTQATKVLDAYLAQEEKSPMLFVLDSMGNLSTEKEMGDVADGKDVSDMTRAKLLRGTFRVLAIKLGRANVPLVVVNHTYDSVGAYVPTKEMGGGLGLKYAATTVVFLSKSKAKDADNQVSGAYITCKLDKSRITVEQKRVDTLLDHRKGLNRYYGLLDVAVKYNLVTKVSTKLDIEGKKVFESQIYKDPEKYFSKELLDKIDKACQQEFKYGQEDEVHTELAE